MAGEARSNMRGSLRRVIVAIGAALTAALAAEAAAIPPDEGEMERLRTTLSHASAVRVTGTFGTQVLREVRLDSTGIASARWGPGAALRPAVFVGPGGSSPPTPSPLAWSRISRIETGRTQTRRLALIGASVGALCGAVVWRTIPTGPDGGRGSGPVMIGVPAMGGLLLGTLLGARSYDWQPLHPRETHSAH